MSDAAMINSVSIRNFKCLRDVHTDLERFTVFVGPNASGKSSILQAMDILCWTFSLDNPEQREGELQQSLSRGAKGYIEFVAESGGKGYRYRTRSPSSQPRHVGATTWNGEGRGIGTGLSAPDWTQWTKRPGSASLPESVLLRLEASKLVNSGLIASPPTTMSR